MESEHKYKVGQVVEVHAALLGGTPSGAYEVVRRLPPTGPTGRNNQYRVKSRQNGQERVIREEDIVRSGL